MTDQELYLNGGIVAHVNTDKPEQVIYLDFLGTQSFSRQRWLIEPETHKVCEEPIRDCIRVEITFNDVRKMYMSYMKQRLLENIMDMDDEQLEEYLVEGC